MNDKPKYYDKRSDFWQGVLDRADDYDTYLANSEPAKAQNWRDFAAKLPALTDEQKERLTGYGRKLHVLLYSGVWCGDCVRQGPMVKRIVDAADAGVELHCIDRDVMPELTDELRVLGAMRVPVVVFLTEDLHEVGRFGDRLLTVYRKKLENEVGAACAVPYAETPVEELAAEQGEWVDLFERMLIMTRLAPPLRQRYDD